MKSFKLLIFFLFMVSLVGCHTLRNGKIRYKKVPQDLKTERVIESRTAEVDREDSQQVFGDISKKQALSSTENENTDVIAEPENAVSNDGLKRKADQSATSTDRTIAGLEEMELADLGQSKSKESLRKTQADPKKERERKKRRKKIIEAAFVALVILSLLAATGIFGEVAAIIGIIVAGALLLMVIIVLIYNYSQGS